MRHMMLLAVLLGLGALAPSAQDAPAEVPDRQETEERFRRLSAKVEDLEATIQSYQQRFVALAEEISQLRQELGRVRDASRDNATQESLKQLAKAIEEVDRKRLADNEKVLNYLSELRKAVTERGAAPKSGSSSPAPSPRSTGAEKGLEWTIRSGDTLSGIVTALSKQGIKVTQKQVMDANPGVNWNRLRVDQKIFIPVTMPP